MASCVVNLFENKEYFFDISMDSVQELLTLTINESFILVNNEYYRQLDEVAMGSPLGPMFPNTSSIIHEVTWLSYLCSSCPMEFKPKNYRRYLMILLYFSKMCCKLKTLSNILITNILILSSPLTSK